MSEKEIDSFYDILTTSGTSRLVITMFDEANVNNTVIPAWRFEALRPFLSVSKALLIIGSYIDAETHEGSLWAALVVDNKNHVYEEWLNNMYGMRTRKE